MAQPDEAQRIARGHRKAPVSVEHRGFLCWRRQRAGALIVRPLHRDECSRFVGRTSIHVASRTLQCHVICERLAGSVPLLRAERPAGWRTDFPVRRNVRQPIGCRDASQTRHHRCPRSSSCSPPAVARARHPTPTRRSRARRRRARPQQPPAGGKVDCVAIKAAAVELLGVQLLAQLKTRGHDRLDQEQAARQPRPGQVPGRDGDPARARSLQVGAR